MELKKAIEKAKKKKHESYASLIMLVNEVIVPQGYTAINHRQELFNIVNNGYGNIIMSKNNVVLDALLEILEINPDGIDWKEF